MASLKDQLESLGERYRDLQFEMAELERASREKDAKIAELEKLLRETKFNLVVSPDGLINTMKIHDNVTNRIRIEKALEGLTEEFQRCT